jgi:hypothetical protein
MSELPCSANVDCEAPVDRTYLRIRRPLEDAMARYARWLGEPEVRPPRNVDEREAIDRALDGAGNWLGLAVYIYASGEWTVFEELSGGLSTRSGETWQQLADGGDLVYAGYNDAIGYGELVVIEAGRLVRHFLQDDQEPGDDVNVGRLPAEVDDPFEDWIGLAEWIDEDDDKLEHAEKGLLWIHRTPE